VPPGLATLILAAVAAFTFIVTIAVLYPSAEYSVAVATVLGKSVFGSVALVRPR
jgi:hypothetical protein